MGVEWVGGALVGCTMVEMMLLYCCCCETRFQSWLHTSAVLVAAGVTHAATTAAATAAAVDVMCQAELHCIESNKFEVR